MRYHNSYIVQEKPMTTLGKKILSVVKAPFFIPQWIVSFLISRAMTHLILSPNVTALQQPIHHIHFSDDPVEKGNVVVNLLPKDAYKTTHDYLLKLSSFFHLSFLATKRKRLYLDNPKHKAHIDHLIKEISLLHAGSSQIKKCVGKAFDWDEIHLKGLDYLDEPLYHYLFEQLEAQHGWQNKQNKETKINFYSLETDDHAVLDSVAVFSESEEKKSMADRKFIITCLANGQNYINWMSHFNYSSKAIGCTVIGFNYRGIDYSQGLVWTENNMIDDVRAQVRMLLEQGAQPENIGLEGMCVGAAVATLAAAREHEQQIKVKLYNERSFRSIPRVLAGAFLPKTTSSPLNPLTWLRYLTAGVIYLVFLPIIWVAGWHMDVASAWEKIPFADKNYSIVRNPNDSDPNAPKEDGVIEDRWASLASLVDVKRDSALKKQKKRQRLTAEEEQLTTDKAETHHFKVSPFFERKNKLPHVLACRHLIESTTEVPKHMHNHMVDSFKQQFFQRHVDSSSTMSVLEQGLHYAVSV
jgi:effector protein SdbA